MSICRPRAGSRGRRQGTVPVAVGAAGQAQGPRSARPADLRGGRARARCSGLCSSSKVPNTERRGLAAPKRGEWETNLPPFPRRFSQNTKKAGAEPGSEEPTGTSRRLFHFPGAGASCARQAGAQDSWKRLPKATGEMLYPKHLAPGVGKTPKRDQWGTLDLK